MKTVEELRSRAKELSKEAALYSRQASEVIQSDRKKGIDLMRQAREAGQRFQVIAAEVIRREQLEN